MSVVVAEAAGRPSAFVKGAPDVLTALLRRPGRREGDRARGRASWAEHGLRVLLVARREELDGGEDPERELEPVGLIGLADTPRASARASVAEARGGRRQDDHDHGRPSAYRGQRRRRAPASPRRRAGLRCSPDPSSTRCRPEELRDTVRRRRRLRARGPGAQGPDRRGAQGRRRDRRDDGRRGQRRAGAQGRPHRRRDGPARHRRRQRGRRHGADRRRLLDDRAAPSARAGRSTTTSSASRTSCFAGNAGEVLAFALAVVLGLGAPLTVLQILLVNLLLDGLPAAALGVDPPERTVMRKPPRRRARGCSTASASGCSWAARRSAAAIFASFLIGAETSHAPGQTMAFTTLVFGRLLFVFTVRGDGPFWRAGTQPASVRRRGAVGRRSPCSCLLVPAVGESFGAVGLDRRTVARRARRSPSSRCRARAVEARRPGSPPRCPPGSLRRRVRAMRAHRRGRRDDHRVRRSRWSSSSRSRSRTACTTRRTRSRRSWPPAARRRRQAIVLAAVFNTLGPLVVGAAVADTIGGIVAIDGRAAIEVIGAGLVAAVALEPLHLVARAPVELGARARRRARRRGARRGRRRRGPVGRPRRLRPVGVIGTRDRARRGPAPRRARGARCDPRAAARGCGAARRRWRRPIRVRRVGDVGRAGVQPRRQRRAEGGRRRSRRCSSPTGGSRARARRRGRSSAAPPR